MRRSILALVALPLLAGAAAAQEPGRWGAIAFGGPERATGTAVDFASAGEARAAALENCGGRCTRTIVFVRNCAAVAESPAGAVGWESSRWRGRAIARALAKCGRQDCTLVAWACTAH
jgi:hypothetical protein